MPGTSYTDPYGHMIVVAKWLPRARGKGMRMGVGAQPDATVGRRRSWHGNVLFTPDVGSEFKRYRPLPTRRAAS